MTKHVLDDAIYSTAPGIASEDEARAALASLITRASESPNDAELHNEVAKAYMFLYQIRKFEKRRAGAPAAVSLDQLWQQASATALYIEAHEAIQKGKMQELRLVRADPWINETLVPAWHALVRARSCCPILPKIHLRMARLSFLVNGVADERLHIARACRLAPSDPQVFSRAGTLDLYARRIDDACRRWRKAIALSERELDYVLDHAVSLLDPETIVQRVLPPSADLLIRLAEGRFATSLQWQTLLLEKAESLARQSNLPTPEGHHQLARIHSLSGNLTDALDQYSKAVQLRPHELSWRYSYGRLLIKTQRYEEARREIGWCARQQPQNANFRRLLERIHREQSTSRQP